MNVNQIQHVTHETKAGVDHLSKDNHQVKVHRWLSPPDPSTNHNEALRQRHPGSGEWFLRSSEYSTWKAGRNSFLWLHGIPGCGKTILSSTIIEDMERDEACSRGLLYFYFNFTDVDKQTLEKMVRSLSYQIYSRMGYRRQLDALYSSCDNGDRQPGINVLCKTLEDIMQQVGEIWIVLDALDECQSRKEYLAGGLLPWIEYLLGVQQQISVHLLVTSRPEQDIQSVIERCARRQDIISIQSNLIEKDIHAYVHTRVRDCHGLSRWRSRPEVQDEIEDVLTEKANGM